MMRWFVKSSLKQPAVVLALAGALLLVGFFVMRKAPLDVFPEFAPPQVEIQTEAPGLSTEEVESLVSMPLEQALNGIPFLQTIRTKSVLCRSSVKLIFEECTDPISARTPVLERLA